MAVKRCRRCRISFTTDSAGVKISELRYKPFGEVRYTWTNAKTQPSYALMKYTFCEAPLEAPLAGTGQYSYTDDPSTPASEGFGLMFYVSRWYDPSLGRFAQADSMLDNPVTGWDRYSYVQNNPLQYTDMTGHLTDKEKCPDGICEDLGKQEKRSSWDEIDGSLLKSQKATDLYKLYI